MIKPKLYLEHVLELDLGDDMLFQLGAPLSAEVIQDEIEFVVPLLREVLGSNTSIGWITDQAQQVGSVYVRVVFYNAPIVRFKVSREKRAFVEESPMLALDDSLKRVPCQVEETPEGWAVSNGECTLFVGRGGAYFVPKLCLGNDIQVQFQADDPRDAIPFFMLSRRQGEQAVGFSLAIHANEHFCGTGERFDRIDLFGRQIDLVNEDVVGVNTARAYKNVPFLLSSRNYGLFVHSTARMRLDIGCQSTQSLQWLVEDNELDFFFFGGGDFSSILHNYRKVTGFPPMPPLWSFGAWMSRFTYWTDKEVEDIAGRLRAERYPMDVIHIDPAWFSEYWKCDWKFSQERFPNPTDFFSRMKEKGFRISLWQWPYIQENTSVTSTAIEKGYAKEPIDPNDRILEDLGIVATLDFTNAEAVAWYQGLLEAVLDKGASVIKVDFGERVHETALYQGASASKYRNMFSLLYQQAAWEITKKRHGEGIVWARAGWAGCQRFPVHWGGDSVCSYSGLWGSLCGGLHLGLSGFAFWSHDVGGFFGVPDFMKGRPTDDLYVRWTQFGVFSSHIRFHGTTSREPWEFPTVASIVREWLRFRYSLLPYIIAQAQKCCTTGLPMLRALVLDWTDDPVAWAISDEYLFGDAFLVCPIINASNTRHVYLPEGKWVDLWNGSVISGPTWLKNIKSPLSRIPVFVRCDESIEFAEPVQCTDQLPEAKRFTIKFDDAYKGFSESKLGELIDL